MCSKLFVFFLVSIVACFGCGIENNANQIVEKSENELTESFQVKKRLIPFGTRVEINHSFSISNSSDEVAEYILESKSCGCLSYLPKSIVIPRNSDTSVEIRGSLTGSRSPSYVDYSATYRNCKSAKLVRLRLASIAHHAPTETPLRAYKWL